jgi:hypothetical protein
MAKSSFVFHLSTRSNKILNDQAKRFGKSKDAVLEYMIQEFAPSTSREIAEQKKRRKEARIDYFKTRSNVTPNAAWLNGFSAG